MSKLEIVQKIANIHNTMAQIQVSGDSAIAMGGALIEMWQLVGQLQQDIQNDEEQAVKEDTEKGDDKKA